MDNLTKLVDRYIAMWNETDAERRRALIAQTWTEDARYVDPVLQAEGPVARLLGRDLRMCCGQRPGKRFEQTVPGRHDRPAGFEERPVPEAKVVS